MTKEERLAFCSICRNQKTIYRQGIVCKLTNELPFFEGTCNSFDEDTELKNRLARVPSQSGMNLAGSGKRFLNFILDTVFYYIFCLVLGFVLGIMLVILPEWQSFIDFENKLVAYAFAIIAWFLYFAVQESMTGRTVAKFITRTKVVNQNGEIPGFYTILLRTVCRLIPFDSFSYLGDGPGWHDELSKTSVVEV